jgi:hypothetical protein
MDGQGRTFGYGVRLLVSSKYRQTNGRYAMARPRFRFNPKVATPILTGMILVIGLLDYKSGFMLSLFPLYLVPLVLVAWHDSKAVTALVSFLAATIIIVKDSFSWLPYRHGFYFYWDEGIKVVLLLVVSYGVYEIKKLLLEKERSNAELKQALSEIKELRQMIPICAWCHSIRNDRGFYERIEVYLGKITGAGFTHGICPNCVEKYYGHLGQGEQQESSKEKDEPK